MDLTKAEESFGGAVVRPEGSHWIRWSSLDKYGQIVAVVAEVVIVVIHFLLVHARLRFMQQCASYHDHRHRKRKTRE